MQIGSYGENLDWESLENDSLNCVNHTITIAGTTLPGSIRSR